MSGRKLQLKPSQMLHAVQAAPPCGHARSGYGRKHRRDWHQALRRMKPLRQRLHFGFACHAVRGHASLLPGAQRLA